MNKDRVKEIKEQIAKLQEELEKLSIEEKSMEFVNLLRSVLLTGECSIVLQGHEEWQFSEKYYMNDISYDIRKEIIGVLNKIATKKGEREMNMSIKKPVVKVEVAEVDTKYNERKINNFKVGDKVWYDGAMRTVVQVPDEKLTPNEVGWLDKDCVVLDLDYDNAIYYKDIELYKSAHDKLLELGWEKVKLSNDIQYEKFNERSRRTMAIRIPKDNEGYYVDIINMVIDLEMSKIITQYLEELENENEKRIRSVEKSCK